MAPPSEPKAFATTACAPRTLKHILSVSEDIFFCSLCTLPSLQSCTFVLRANNSYCITSTGPYNLHTTAGACAAYCFGNMGSTPPFCFDYNPTRQHCECSNGADRITNQTGYTAYTYQCASRKSAQGCLSKS